jgi:hypothetical protein
MAAAARPGGKRAASRRGRFVLAKNISKKLIFAPGSFCSDWRRIMLARAGGYTVRE